MAMNLEDLVLREISFPEHLDRKRELGIPMKPGARIPAKAGFVDIEEPLVYDCFEQLLEIFKRHHNGRRASTPNPGWGDLNSKWVRCKRHKLNDKNIKTLSDLGRLNGVLFVHFYGGDNNEIGFEPFNGKVVSASLIIPGSQRYNYHWKGSKKWYRHINGIYVPSLSIK